MKMTFYVKMSRRRNLDSQFQAVAVIERLVEPIIARQGVVKCVENEGECRYVRDPILLLNQLDIEHPVGQYVVSVCNGFVKQYKTGGNTLLFFVCEWMKAASLLCEMGLSNRTITTLLRTSIEECISHAETHGIDVNTLTSEPVANTESDKDIADQLNKHSFTSKVQEYHGLAQGLKKKETKHSKKSSIVQEPSYEVGNSCEKNLSNSSSKTLNQQCPYSSSVVDMISAQTETKQLSNNGFKEIAFKQTTTVLNPDFGPNSSHDNSVMPSNVQNSNTSTVFNQISRSHVSKQYCLNKVSDALNTHVQKTEIKRAKKVEDRSGPIIDHGIGSVKTNHSVDDTDDDDFSWFFTPANQCETTLDANEHQAKDSTELTSHSVPIIALKMENIKHGESGGEDEDDISWFFTAESETNKGVHEDKVTDFVGLTTLNTQNGGHAYNEEMALNHTKGITEALNASSVSHDNIDDNSVEVIDDNDTALIRDLTNLKRNIETDLEILKTRSVRKTDSKLEHEEEENDVDDEFENSWSIFESHKLNRETTLVEKHESDTLDDDHDFVTVQISFDENITEPAKSCLGCRAFSTNEMTVNQIEKECQRTCTSAMIVDRNDLIKQSSTEEVDPNCYNQDQVGTVTQDLKKFDDILKSLNKEVKTKPYSGSILNNSRHFRTFQTVCSQASDTVLDCDLNDEVSSGAECLDNQLYKGVVTDHHDHSSELFLDAKQKDETKVNINLDLQKSVNCERTTSLVDKSGQADKVQCGKDLATAPAYSQTSLSDINGLLNRLTSGKLSSGPHKLMCKDNQGKQSLDRESDSGSFVSKGHKINSAVSVRSRHLNMDVNTAERGFTSEKSSHGTIPGKTDVEVEDIISKNNVKPKKLIEMKSLNGSRDVKPSNSEIIDETENLLHSEELESDILKNQTDYLFNTDEWDEKRTTTAADTASIYMMGQRPKSGGILDVIEGLLSETDEGIVKVICDVVSTLKSQGNLSMLDKLLDCFPISGLKREPRLVQGLVIKTPLDCVTALYRIQGKPCRCLLVNADITATFRHKGYKSPSVTTSHTVDGFRHQMSKTDTWVQQVTTVLRKLNVDLILSRGSISGKMVSVCDSSNMVAIENVPYRKLKLLSDITETDMATYIKLVSEDNVCSGVRIHHLRGDAVDKNVLNTDQMCEVTITLEHNNPQSVVLSEMTPVLVDLKEQELWECLHRVTLCLQTGLLLPGNGQTEAHCIQFLRNQKETFLNDYNRSKDPNKHCLPVVYETVEQSFQKYVSIFRIPVRSTEMDCVYDDLTSKCAAWRAACNTVCTILNIEYYILTGITTEMDLRDRKLIESILC